MWGIVEDGWYIPSIDEWVAFAKTLEVTSGNYGNLELSYGYWSSSLYDSGNAWYVGFYNDLIISSIITNIYYVRLGTTF